MRKLFVFFVSIILFFSVSCKKNKFDVDISGSKVEIKAIRFENKLFAINSDSLQSEVVKLSNQFPHFFDLYNIKIIKIGSSVYDINYVHNLALFLKDYGVKEASKKVNTEFVNFSEIENQLSNAFSYIKYYYPEKNIPKFYTYISGFNQSVVTDDSLIGIGLDKYLGAKCELYKMLELPEFIKKRMTSDRIVFDCVMAWANMEFPYNDKEDNVLSQMVHSGKILYFLDAIFPFSEDFQKIAYTKEQIEWCKLSESSMWRFIIDKKLLFSSEYMEIKKLIGDGPNTSYFSKNSPDRIGIWFGWNIVRKYMENNSKVSLQDLMKDTNYMQIFKASKYKPK